MSKSSVNLNLCSVDQFTFFLSAELVQISNHINGRTKGEYRGTETRREQ